tara:strand:+ start:132 stop:374 length:243 start_codon:yes stop_codon:yes gene_type:complete
MESPQANLESNMTDDSDNKIEIEQIEEYVPIGIMSDTSENMHEYEITTIPKLPYRTHKDLIAPPKFVVDTKCPECPDNWE